jgi:hypothetical protein
MSRVLKYSGVMEVVVGLCSNGGRQDHADPDVADQHLGVAPARLFGASSIPGRMPVRMLKARVPWESTHEPEAWPLMMRLPPIRAPRGLDRLRGSSDY